MTPSSVEDTRHAEVLARLVPFRQEPPPSRRPFVDFEPEVLANERGEFLDQTDFALCPQEFLNPLG